MVGVRRGACGAKDRTEKSGAFIFMCAVLFLVPKPSITPAALLTTPSAIVPPPSRHSTNE